MRKLTHDEQVAAIAKVNPNVEVLGQIINNSTKVLCRCLVCGHEWNATPNDLKDGSGCPECGKIKVANKLRLTHAEQVAIINKINPHVEVLEEIKGSLKKVKCRCKICGHEWNVKPSSLKIGRGCPECSKIKRANKRRLTHAEHAAAINKVNPNIEILEEITNVNKKVLCRCLVCDHEWRVTPGNLKQKHGCPECKKVKITNARRLTHAEQVEAIAKVNPKVEVLEEIKGDSVKVLCRCKVCHHKWRVTPDSLKHGRGCPKCRGGVRLSHEEHVAAINKVNPNVEILGEIINNSAKVLCLCKTCGHKWNARPYSLKAGCGCPECKKVKASNRMRMPHIKHVADIAKINPNVEILGEIINVGAKVLCRCKVCRHEWNAKPNDLKKGDGCPRCAKYGFKRHETGKLYVMVDDLNVPTMMKIGVSVQEDKRSKEVLKSAHKAGVTIPALHVAKTWEGPTDLMQRIESMMHENYAEWNIKFPAKFDGHTEFFYYTPETAEAFDIIEETYHELINANQAA